jgi:hypothetical protein
MNSGVHVLNHLGHANFTYDMKLITGDLPALTNTDYFFLYSQGCDPGGFDAAQCFGEVITTMAHGAFAAVLNAREGLSRSNSTAGPSQYYDREFWDALFGEGIRELGRMNADSKEDNDFRINDTGMRWCFYELNLFGDPAVELQNVSSRGEVILDAGAYPIPGTATATVMDADLDANPASPDTVAVALTSGAEAAPESLVLTETGASTKIFRGSIQAAAGSAVPGDGILQVSDGDTITVTYRDADHGSGSPADVEDTAMADGAAPVISDVRFSASAKICLITWETNEPATSAVSYGSAPPPGVEKAACGLAASHSVWITGLSPLTTYCFSVTSADAVGNSSTDTNGGAWYSFTTPEHGTILFVDDDEGDPYHEGYFTSALNATPYRYEVWDVATVGSAPTAADLALYQTVVWNCGVNSYASNAGISPTEEAALAGYMNDGGGVFLCGQDVIGYNGVSEGFLTDYLHVGDYAVNDNTSTARGIAGDPVSDGMTLPLDYTFTNFSDTLAPGAGASGAFIKDGRTPYPYCAVRYPAEGASSPHRIVFFAFPFEAISSSAADPNNAKTVMDRVLCFISPVQITEVSPSYGLNDAPVTLTVTGAHFTQDLAVSLGGVTLAVPTRTPGELRAVVPAGIAAGAYDLAMTSLYSMKGVSPAAYTALVPSGDDDADGLTNRDEVDIYGTDPFLSDTDEDGLSDYAEVITHHTDPFDPDADHDGLLDGEEILWGTSTVLSDTDGDGIGDYIEVRCGDGGAAHDPGRVPAVRVNFQPSGMVCPTGYAPDHTSGYTSKGYGWIPNL